MEFKVSIRILAGLLWLCLLWTKEAYGGSLLRTKRAAVTPNLPDKKLQAIGSTEQMKDAGWTIRSDKDMSRYKDQCEEANWFGFKENGKGSISATFNGAGQATLAVGNCAEEARESSVVVVSKNFDELIRLEGRQGAVSVSFDFTPGDRLTIKEFDNGIIALKSLKIEERDSCQLDLQQKICMYGKMSTDAIFNMVCHNLPHKTPNQKTEVQRCWTGVCITRKLIALSCGISEVVLCQCEEHKNQPICKKFNANLVDVDCNNQVDSNPNSV